MYSIDGTVELEDTLTQTIAARLFIIQGVSKRALQL
jgi:hypothetical protein